MLDDYYDKWDTPFDYNPLSFTHEPQTSTAPGQGATVLDEEVDRLLTKENFNEFKLNALDDNGRIDRRSHHGPYEFLEEIFPRCAFIR